MSYRIESSKTSRAGCQNKPCKDEGIKIQKGELRFGVWVVIQEQGGFRWRHWGCISGKVMENLREYLEQGDPDTGYKWDFFDGLDELSEEDQKKVKTAVIQGKIADEDWKGDPEFNVLGQTGTVARAKKAKKSDESADNNDSPPAKKAAKKPRAKKEKAEVDGEEETKPVVKRERKVKKEVKDESANEADVKPPVKREKKVKKEVKSEVKDESGEEIDVKPAAKRDVKVKQEIKDESGDEVDVDPAAAKKSAAKKNGSKKEDNSDGEVKMNDIPQKQAPAKKTAAKKIKNENADAEEDTKPAKKAAKKAAPKKKVKTEGSENDSEAEADVKPAAPSRAERAAKRSASDLSENKKPAKKVKKASAEGKQKIFDDRLKVLMQSPANVLMAEEGWGPIADLLERHLADLALSDSDIDTDNESLDGSDHSSNWETCSESGSGSDSGSDDSGDIYDSGADDIMDPDAEEALLSELLGGHMDPWDYRPGWSDDEDEHHLYAMGMGGYEFQF